MKRKQKVIETISMHFQVTGEFITEKARAYLLEHRLRMANEILDCLIPKPKPEHRKAVLLGHAEFIGVTLCKNPDCDQCKGEKPFAMIFKEDKRYQNKLEKHKKYIKENYIEIDGDVMASKQVVGEITEKQNVLSELKKLRKEEKDNEDIYDDRSIKSKIVDAEDDLEYKIEKLYQEFGISTTMDYEIGSRDWKNKLEVDGLLELIKAKSVSEKSVRRILSEGKRLGKKLAMNEINSKKRLLSFHENFEEIEKKVTPSKKTIKVGKFDIPENLLKDYVESVKAMRTSMIIGTSRQDPLIGANALQLRITQHKRIFEALKIPYHGEDKSTKESQELYDVVEKYIEIKYPELTLDNVGNSLKRKFGKERKERKSKK